MKRDQYWQKPKGAKADHGEAWWYANKGSIELHVASGFTQFTVKITRKALAEYVKRSGR